MKIDISDNKKQAVKQGWLRAILFFFAFIFGLVIFQLIGVYAIKIFYPIDLMNLKKFISNSENFHFKIFLQFVTMAGILLIVWIFRKFVDRRTMKSLGFENENRNHDMIYGFLSGFGLMLLGFIVLYFSGNLEIIDVVPNPIPIFEGLLFYIAVSITEEVVVRGYILNNFMLSMNKYLALIISAILFALLHIANSNVSLLGIVNIVLAGILLGIGYIYTKSLWFPIFLHLSWNYFQGPIFGFEVSGDITQSVVEQKVIGSELITGGEFGFEGSIIATGLIIICIIFVNYKYKNNSFSNKADIIDS